MRSKTWFDLLTDLLCDLCTHRAAFEAERSPEEVAMKLPPEVRCRRCIPITDTIIYEEGPHALH